MLYSMSEKPKQKRIIRRENWQPRTSVSLNLSDLNLVDQIRERMSFRTRTGAIIHAIRRLADDELVFEKKFEEINTKLDALLERFPTEHDENHTQDQKNSVARISLKG